MALFAYSFTGTKTIRVVGAASAPVAGLPGERIIEGASFAAGTTKGAACRITELVGGRTVFFTRAEFSYGGYVGKIPEQKVNGIKVTTCPVGCELVIYIR